jgi:predicted tellurium resistance membrane protein TerC
MNALFTLEGILSLVSLVGLEIVLGIDNIVFIAIVAGKLPVDQREKARVIGLSLAIFTRVLLLLMLSWFMGVQGIGFTFGAHHVSVRDVVLFGGGIFLIYKATHEIHSKIDKNELSEEDKVLRRSKGFWQVIVQILMIDLIFSLDSVITAIGMASSLFIMVLAVVLSIMFMLFSSKAIVSFIDEHPTIKMLALSFLLMIGVLLVAESFHQEFSKGYVYFAMAFSLGVELLNIRARSNDSL